MVGLSFPHVLPWGDWLKYLITGITGLVGRHLMEMIEASDHELVVMGRDLDRVETRPTTIKCELDLTADLSKFDVLDDYGRGWTWIHVAAAIAGAPPAILNLVNVKGTEKLVNKAKELQIERFILVSSITIYGTQYEGQLVEDTQPHPEYLYGQTKLEQEDILIGSGIPYTIVRPPYIGGPGDRNFTEEIAKRIERGKLPSFSREGHITYVDARDLSRAMIHLSQLDEAVGQIYNIISGHTTYSQFSQMLADRLDISPPFGPRYPYRVAMVLGLIGELATKLGIKTRISRYRIRTMCRQFVLDSSKAEKAGFTPQYTISQSLDDWVLSRT